MSNSSQATAAPMTPPSSASSMVSISTETITGTPRKPMARSVAISRARVATAAYMVLSAPNTAPIAMIDRDHRAENADQRRSAASDCSL